jgi:hypothetical protein
VTTITLLLRLADADRALAGRLVTALERLVAAAERAVPRRRHLSLSRGLEQPRTTEGTAMATPVRRANELKWDISSTDAITGAGTDLSGITWTPTVEPPEAGELTVPDAEGLFYFRPAEGMEGTTCAVEIRGEFADGSEPQILTDSVTIEPDGRVLSMGQAVEQGRAAPAPGPAPTPSPEPAPADGGGTDAGTAGPADTGDNPPADTGGA